MNTTKEQRAPLIEEGLIVLLCGGTLTDVCRNLDISKSTWYRWKHEYNHGKIELSDNSERFLSIINEQKRKIIFLERKAEYLTLQIETDRSLWHKIKKSIKELFCF